MSETGTISYFCSKRMISYLTENKFQMLYSGPQDLYMDLALDKLSDLIYSHSPPCSLPIWPH